MSDRVKKLQEKLSAVPQQVLNRKRHKKAKQAKPKLNAIEEEAKNLPDGQIQEEEKKAQPVMKAR